MIRCIGGPLDKLEVEHKGTRFMCIEPEGSRRHFYDLTVIRYFDKIRTFYVTDNWNSRDVVLAVKDYIKQGLL